MGHLGSISAEDSAGAGGTNAGAAMTRRNIGAEALRHPPPSVDDPVPLEEDRMKAELLTTRPRWGGLFGKYVVSFVGLVIFVLAVNGALEMYITYRDTTNTLIAAQSEKAEAVAQRIEQQIAEIERQISWATRASSGTVEQHRSDYALLLQQVPALEELVHIDGSGRERLNVGRRRVVTGSGIDYARDPKFTDTVVKGVWFGPAYFRRDSEPFMTIAMAHSGRNAGVTVAEINLAFLADLISGAQTGKTAAAYTYIVGPRNQMLTHSDVNMASRSIDLSGLPQVAAVRAGAHPDSIGRDPEDRRVLTAFAAIPRMNWLVFVEQPLRQAFAPLVDLMFRLGWLLVMGLVVAVIAGTVLARRMIVPIRALQAGASRLGAGEFSHRLQVRTDDEIETLADQFNHMAEQLQESYTRLEHKVEERTRDLAQSVRELKALEEIGRALASSLDVKAVLATIVTRAVDLAQADGGAIYGYDQSHAAFRLAEAHGLDASLVDAIRSARIEEAVSVLGEAARKREPLLIPNLADIPNYPLRDVTLAAGFNSVLIVPLVGAEGILGALVVQRKAAGAFPANTVGLMQTFAHQSVLAMHNAHLFHEVEEKGQQLAIANEHKSQFFANMSHELRTPLNAVLGYTELIVDGLYGEIPDKAKEVLDRVQINGKHLLGLINDVLDLSKIEAGQLKLALEDYSMKSVVDAVVATAGSLAQSKGLSIKSAVSDNLPLGRGDERRLTQVLLNLVGNAIKFTDAGEVEIRAKAVNGTFDLAVRDTGPGIAPQDQARIFDDFQQIDNTSTRHKGGTGLGLAISRRFVQMHGGTLTVDSAVGIGSTFHIVLPVRVEQQAGPA
jgi:signal transduction histidine kinase